MEESVYLTQDDGIYNLLSGKPRKIQPIVWGEGTQTQTQTQTQIRAQESLPIQTQVSQPQGPFQGQFQSQFQGHFHGHGSNRGMGNVRPPMQHHRGRSNFPRGRSQAPRGQRAMRSNRGNMYGRPPMY